MATLNRTLSDGTRVTLRFPDELHMAVDLAAIGIYPEPPRFTVADLIDWFFNPFIDPLIVEVPDVR